MVTITNVQIYTDIERLMWEVWGLKCVKFTIFFYYPRSSPDALRGKLKMFPNSKN